ncbi:MAG TPA: ABC transporter permease, partial [Pyrinomonadaceae bacterium]|nr:ABC transporter permease [Pyrinomonadaceae bacterium]
MPYEIFLALRYLRSRPKRRLARVTALMAILGIAMGVAALIVALALGNGFRDEMRDKILQGTEHLSVLRADGRPIEDQATVAARLRKIEGVVSASATTYDGALARGSKGSAYAVLRGIKKGGNEAQAQRWLIQGRIDPLFDTTSASESIPQTVVGSELATKIGLSVGDVFEVIGAEGGP